jgi:lipopolysaccharide transport system permease protein
MKNLFGFKKYKDLFIQLTLREIKGKYKQSILGYAWVILVPLLNLLVLSIVFSYFFRVSTGPIPYAIYLFVGLVPWTFNANAITTSSGSIIANSSLITKVNFPRQIILFSSIAAKVVDLFLLSLVLVLFLFIYKIPFHFTMLYIPLIFFVHLLLVTGISLIFAATNVFYRDVENILGIFLTIWMYLTPIFYTPEFIPIKVRFLFGLNPMVGIVNSYRNSILYGAPIPWNSFGFSIAISIILLILGLFFFKKMSKSFADVI